MLKRVSTGFWLVILSLSLALSTFSVESRAADLTNLVFHPVSPGPADGRIACLTANFLQENHYLRQRFDDTISSKFLDRYLEALDPQHLHFVQSDLAEFERYRTNLDDLTCSARGIGDTRPSCEIFNRFMERLQQRVGYADQILKSETFQFDSDDRIVINRHELPYPKDLEAAKTLWRERLRFEYLQEHLAKISAKKKKETDAADKKTVRKTKTEAEEIVDTLSHRYHRNLRTYIDWNNDDVLQIYLTTLAHVYDPHSDYMGHAQLDSFSISMSLSLFGIGAELVSEDGYCTIRRLLPGGPASKSKKIKEKDRIIAVAQADATPVDVVEMNLTKAVQLIRGPKGTEVRLTIIPAGADAADTEIVSLVRDEIRLEDQEAKAKVIECPNAAEPAQNVRLGVIDLPSFYATYDLNQRERKNQTSTTADVKRLLTKLKQENINGVILDLRRNGGGSLEEAIRLTGLFIKGGPVVLAKDADGNLQEDKDPDNSVTYDGPLIVLTSRFSASASEILAGALQDYGRALIVGDSSTHGKGTVQSVNQLRPYMNLADKSITNDPGALKLTIKKFYRASGASTQLKGITPDIVLPSVLNESKDIGEVALENPLAWDTIPSSKYDPVNMVAPYLPELRKRSAARVSVEKDFDYIREDIEQFKQIQADKTISLNEKQRLKEKEEADARQKARDKERLARKEPNEKVYELTLRQVNVPGLVEKTNAAVAKLNLKGANAGASTNSASASTRVPDDNNLEDDADEEKPPAIDVSLGEAQHILIDYLSVLAKENVVTGVPARRHQSPN